MKDQTVSWLTAAGKVAFRRDSRRGRFRPAAQVDQAIEQRLASALAIFKIKQLTRAALQLVSRSRNGVNRARSAALDELFRHQTPTKANDSCLLTETTKVSGDGRLLNR